MIDRATTLAAPPEQVWPWLVQLGKGRAGWYFPRRVERFLPRKGCATSTRPAEAYRRGRDRATGGRAMPVFRATAVDAAARPGLALVARSRTGHRWPSDPSAPSVLALSWALILRPVVGGTRLHIRLRLRVKHTALAKIGAVFDWLTIVALFAGLRERVSRSEHLDGAGPLRRGRRPGRRVQLALPALLRRGDGRVLPRARPARRWPSRVQLVTSTLTWTSGARWGEVVEVDATCTRVGRDQLRARRSRSALPGRAPAADGRDDLRARPTRSGRPDAASRTTRADEALIS